MISVAIDGPSGAGKSTLARRAAAALGFLYVDTGAMYRAIGLYASRRGAELKDADAVGTLLPSIRLRLGYRDDGQHIYLNDEDVTAAVRAEEMGMAASAVSGHPCVRAFLLQVQRDMAAAHDVLMDGRDIGTVVLPNATVKVFLTASVDARAARRYKECVEKGQDTTLEKVRADLEQRDWQDTHRAEAPLRRADDALLLDTSEMDFEESYRALVDLIRSKAGI